MQMLSTFEGKYVLPPCDPPSVIGSELVQCIPHLGRMSEQLSETSAQIEESIVAVCASFQGIADRARRNAQGVTGMLGQTEAGSASERSFESLHQACANTMVKLLDAAGESGRIAGRAIERIQRIDTAAKQITGALGRLEMIASGNKILALNARIEAAHSETHGAGFGAVAVELSLQTDRSREVTAQLGTLADDLRALANSTVSDLQQMQVEDEKRARRCRTEVDETLIELRATHEQMQQMLTTMTKDGATLATDIGAAVRGLQFQDRVSQRIAHVVGDLAVVRDRMASHLGTEVDLPLVADKAFSGQSMREERAVYGHSGDESPAGDVELF
jgi:methyl-accepting chemotaxis protein